MTTSAGNTIRCYVGLGFLLLVGLPWMMVSCEPSYESGVVSFTGQTMGTRYKVSLAAKAPSSQWPTDTNHVRRLVNQKLDEINRQMSTYDPESEISRFNQSESNEWFPVSDETAFVVAFALEIGARTEGAFDPTIGPVVNVWGFGPGQQKEVVPSEQAILKALARIGYQKLEVRKDPPALRKSNPGIYLDLSAIAKGYAVDQVTELLKAQGFGGTLVEIGGEVRTTGSKPDLSPWRIAIEKSEHSPQPFQQVLELSDAALATSGDYYNFFVKDGIRYSHSIDPQTGRPVHHALAVVSVQADTCMEADALATALLVMGTDRGYDWCIQHAVAGLFQYRHRLAIDTRSTPRFRQLYGIAE